MTKQVKDSGVEWIGKIPMSWETRRLKIALEKEKEVVEKYNGENILSLTMNGVVVRDLINPKGKMPTTFDGYQKISKGNLITCLFDIDVTPRCVGIAYNDGLTSPAYTQYKLINNFYTDFIYYYLLMLDNDKILVPITKSLRNTIKSEDFLNLEFSFPDFISQKRIAEYITSSILKINQIISDTQKSIEELKKYKQTLITEVVIKGVDRNIEMKDSGVEWIGEIPEHWLIRKLKTCTEIISKGTTPKDMSTVQTEVYKIRYIKSENIVDNFVISNPEFFITESVNLELKRSQLNCNDILFVIAGASLGKVALMNSDLLPANTNQAISFFRIKDELTKYKKYIWYFLQSDVVKTFISLYSVKSAQPNISMEKLGNIVIPFPNSESEIKKIISYLDKKCTDIESLIKDKETSIQELENYKKSLIYECVTGKKQI